MKAWLEEMLHEKVELAIAPLIDVVFLLLIYFMVTSSLKKEETDLGIQLPGLKQKKGTVLKMPDEQIIEVYTNGDIVLNGKIFGRNDPDLVDLVVTLQRYKLQAERANSKALITIQADGDSMHQRSIDVLNACAAAQLKYVSFGMGD